MPMDIPSPGSSAPSSPRKSDEDASTKNSNRKWPVAPVSIPTKTAPASSRSSDNDSPSSSPPLTGSAQQQWPGSAPGSSPVGSFRKTVYAGSQSFTEGTAKHGLSPRGKRVSPLLGASAVQSSPDHSSGSSPMWRRRHPKGNTVIPLSLAGSDGVDGHSSSGGGSKPSSPVGIGASGTHTREPAQPGTPASRRVMRRCCPCGLFALMRKESWQLNVPHGAEVYSRHTTRSKIHNTINVPGKLEGLLSLGTLMCLDSYLFLFTLFPLRLLSATLHALPRLLPAPAHLRSRISRPLRTDEKVDIIRGLCLISCTAALLLLADIPRAYHVRWKQDDARRVLRLSPVVPLRKAALHALSSTQIIRGQAVIKLYVVRRGGGAKSRLDARVST